MFELSQIRVAAIATDGFEESELHDPLRALIQAGACVKILAPRGGEIRSFQHTEPSAPVRVDQILSQARPDDYDAVLLPGGVMNADALCAVPEGAFLRVRDASGGQAFRVHLSCALVAGFRQPGARTQTHQLPHAPG